MYSREWILKDGTLFEVTTKFRESVLEKESEKGPDHTFSHYCSTVEFTLWYHKIAIHENRESTAALEDIEMM